MPECMDCAKLPTLVDALNAVQWDEGQATQKLKAGVDWRPASPRPIHPASGPRSPRCATHRRAWLKAAKQRASDKRSRWRSGLDDSLKAEVIDEQGGRCPCGAPLLPKSGKRLNPIADHDHDKAREHDHPDEVACEDCMRGYLCAHTNREIIGFLTQAGRGAGARVSRSTAEVVAALRAIADYLEDPPAQRVQRRRFYSQQEDERESAAMWHVHGITG